MAAAFPSTTLECSICCESLKSPKILTCGHTFCLDCIHRYIGDKKETFPCPICQTDITIPEGGAKMFTTNFILQTLIHGVKLTMPTSPIAASTPTSTITAGTPTSLTTPGLPQSGSPVNHYCTDHNKPVDYYCISCHSLICHKCFVKNHQGHEYLDVDCETTKEKAEELVTTSENIIQNKIKELEETHTKLEEASKKLLSYTENACSRITKQTEKIIADIQTNSEKVKSQIRNQFEESECTLTGARENIMKQMKNVKLDLETNLPSTSQDDCVPILASLPKMKELEKLCKSMKDDSPAFYTYTDWEESNFSLDVGLLGSVVTKSCFLQLHNYRFDINKMCAISISYSEDKISINGIEVCCSAWKYDNDLKIGMEMSVAGNPRLNNCIIDGQLSILNTDDSKTITESLNNQKLTTGGYTFVWSPAIDWNTLIDKNNGYLNSDNQFIVQFDIKQIKDTNL